MIFSLLIVAFGLALALVIMASKRIKEEGITVSDEKRQHFVRDVEEVQRQQAHDKMLMESAGDPSAAGIIFSKSSFGRELNMGIETATKAVYAGLTEKGYILFNNKNVTKTLNRTTKPACFMLRMYHPEISGKVFDLVPRVGLYACETIVRQDMSDVVHVEFIDPTIASPLARYHELDELAHRLKTDMMQVLQDLDDGSQEKAKAPAAQPAAAAAEAAAAAPVAPEAPARAEPADKPAAPAHAHHDLDSTVIMHGGMPGVGNNSDEPEK